MGHINVYTFTGCRFASFFYQLFFSCPSPHPEYQMTQSLWAVAVSQALCAPGPGGFE